MVVAVVHKIRETREKESRYYTGSRPNRAVVVVGMALTLNSMRLCSSAAIRRRVRTLLNRHKV